MNMLGYLCIIKTHKCVHSEQAETSASLELFLLLSQHTAYLADHFAETPGWWGETPLGASRGAAPPDVALGSVEKHIPAPRRGFWESHTGIRGEKH